MEAARHHLAQAVGIVGPLDQVVGAVADRLHRHGDVAVAGHYNDRDLRVLLPYVAPQLQAVHARHLEIGDDHSGEPENELPPGA
jgi:hypothetical protein